MLDFITIMAELPSVYSTPLIVFLKIWIFH